MVEIEFIPYTESIHEYVNKEGEMDAMDLITFKVLPSNWIKGMKPYIVKFYLEQSLWDLKTRIIRYNCTCKDYINRKRKCKHLRTCEEIINKFKDISYDKVPVS